MALCMEISNEACNCSLLPSFILLLFLYILISFSVGFKSTQSSENVMF